MIDQEPYNPQIGRPALLERVRAELAQTKRQKSLHEDSLSNLDQFTLVSLSQEDILQGKKEGMVETREKLNKEGLREVKNLEQGLRLIESTLDATVSYTNPDNFDIQTQWKNFEAAERVLRYYINSDRDSALRDANLGESDSYHGLAEKGKENLRTLHHASLALTEVKHHIGMWAQEAQASRRKLSQENDTESLKATNLLEIWQKILPGTTLIADFTKGAMDGIRVIKTFITATGHMAIEGVAIANSKHVREGQVVTFAIPAQAHPQLGIIFEGRASALQTSNIVRFRLQK